MKFISTQSIADFKSSCKSDELQVIKNPHTEKLFFTCGNTTGKVSTKGYNKPVVSLCEVDNVTEGTVGEQFYMLHSASETNVIATL